MHPKLLGHPTDLPRFGALALQRAGHASPVQAEVDHAGVAATANIEWLAQELAQLEVLDGNSVTENGAEAVALVYVSARAGWVMKRRLQQKEHADWLLQNDKGWLALEVSGTAEGDPFARMKEKKQQIGQCSLAAERLAVVVAFDRPTIVADSP